MAFRLLLSLALACALLPVEARQPMLSASGGGGADCPLDAGTDPTASTETPRPEQRPATPARPRSTAPRRSGGDADAAARPPRWHSFLPGMIR